MKLLSGTELADYIKTRQAAQVRTLGHLKGFTPRLAIVQSSDNPVINTYVRLKKAYGQDIDVKVDVYKKDQAELPNLIKALNQDQSIHGIIVQLPLSDATQTEQIINLVNPEKDVDALGSKAKLDPATPTAINWLLAGYNINLNNKKIVIAGNGRLVGAPLAKMWRLCGYNVQVLDKTNDLTLSLKNAEVIVAATGSPELITSGMIPIGAIVVDAGVASDSGKTAGDVASEVYQRSDLTITPAKGGVGPLTVAALFDNLIISLSKLPSPGPPPAAA